VAIEPSPKLVLAEPALLAPVPPCSIAIIPDTFPAVVAVVAVSACAALNGIRVKILFL
jgi:hypothetical protein